MTALEVMDRIVGGMPVSVFFEQFFPSDKDGLREFLDKVPDNFFDEIPSTKRAAEEDSEDEDEGVDGDDVEEGDDEGDEDKIRAVFLKLLTEYDLCPGFVFRDHSSSGDPSSQKGHQRAPDIGMYRREDAPPANCRRPDFNKLALPFTLKTAAAGLPFADGPSGASPKDLRDWPYLPQLTNTNAIETLGQLANVMDKIFSRQHVTHVFTVFIRDPIIRFLRADRSGIIVSRGFNFRTDSKTLAEFLWRFSCASDAQRGVDTTVHCPNQEEIEIARRELTSYSSSIQPIVKIDVPDGKGVRQVLAWGTLTRPGSLMGCGTKAFPVWDLELEKVCFLKDSWRSDELEKETELLVELEARGVPNIPHVIAGGDLHSADGTRCYQTMTQKYVDKAWRTGDVGDVNHPDYPLERRIHHRILEDFVPESIFDCKNARELMTVIQDTLEAHRGAYELDIIHRDINDKNVLLARRPDGSVKGILGGWDKALRLRRDLQQNLITPHIPRQHDRTGNWFFMSGLLLQDVTKAHTLQDDMESFFYLVLYLSMFWFPHTGAKSTLADFIEGVFKEYIFDHSTMQFTGGSNKVMMLLFGNHIEGLQFTDNQPLTDWIKYVHSAFQEFHYIRKTKPVDQLQVGNHTFMTDKLAEVLQQPGWSNEKLTEDAHHQQPGHKRKDEALERQVKKQKKEVDSVYLPSGGSPVPASGSGSRLSRRSWKLGSSGCPSK